MGWPAGFLVIAMTCAALFAGGAVWHSGALRQAYAAGDAAGRARADADIRTLMARQALEARADFDAARAEAADMEQKHARLQEKLDALEQDAASGLGDSRECLSADLVRKLDALGRDSGPDRGSP